MAKSNICNIVSEILNDYLEDSDIELYDVKFVKEGKNHILRVLIDRVEDCEEEYINITECEDVTSFLNDKLDEIDIIKDAYILEVSSPGLDRELISDKDFRKFTGRLVDIKLYEPLDGQKDFQATLIGKNEKKIKVEFDENIIEISQNKIAKIKLAVVF